MIHLPHHLVKVELKITCLEIFVYHGWNIHFYIKVFNNMIKPLLHCRETFQFDR